jgi:hypothetical protein
MSSPEQSGLYNEFAVWLISAIGFFSVGAVKRARQQRYRHQLLGKQLAMHIVSHKDLFGRSWFSLVEEYNIAGRGLNCSISNDYNFGGDAAYDMTQHAVGHANLILHVHGSSCMKHSVWLALQSNVDDWLSVGWFLLLVASFCLAVCIARECESRRVQRRFEARAVRTEEGSINGSNGDIMSV